MAYLLIVDDDLDFATAVGAVLHGKGHEVEIETECDRTVEHIRRRRPDLLILDVMFPENDTAGFEMARLVRRTFGELPVLLLTAVNQSFPLGFSNKDLDKTWLPASGFVEKPIDFAVLNDMVTRILAEAPPAAGSAAPASQS